MVTDDALAVNFRIATGAEVSRVHGHNRWELTPVGLAEI
jgi:hypothetical protein